MKALRYLLIVMSLVSVLSVTAQGTAQLPEAQMQSTSVMVSSGSNLPQAAATGAYITGETPGTYSPARIKGGGRPRKGLGDGDDDVTVPEDNLDPDFSPIGDALIPLMLLAGLYLIIRVGRKRARA